MDRWSQLSMSEKSDLMSLYIRNGISSLEEIKKHYNNFATGGSLPDYDPDNPNHYHNPETGEKIILDDEAYELANRNEYTKAMSFNILKAINEHNNGASEYNQFIGDLKRGYEYNIGNNYQNYRNFASSLPDGYSFTSEGIIIGPDGTPYVESGYKQSPRFTYNTDRPLQFDINQGKPNERNLTFYPINIPKPQQGRVITKDELRIAQRKAYSEYVIPRTKFYGDRYYTSADTYDRVTVNPQTNKRTYTLKGKVVNVEPHSNKPVTFDRTKLIDTRRVIEPTKEEKIQNVRVPLFATGGHLYREGGPDDDKYSFLRREPEIAVADNTRVALQPTNLFEEQFQQALQSEEEAKAQAEFERRQVRRAKNEAEARAREAERRAKTPAILREPTTAEQAAAHSNIEVTTPVNTGMIYDKTRTELEEQAANWGRSVGSVATMTPEMVSRNPLTAVALGGLGEMAFLSGRYPFTNFRQTLSTAGELLSPSTYTELLGASPVVGNLANTALGADIAYHSIQDLPEAAESFRLNNDLGSGLRTGLDLLGVSPLYSMGKAGVGLVGDAANAVQKLKPVYLTPKQGYAYRRIDNKGFQDLVESGMIRPNQQGVFAREGHIQSGTWFNLDTPARGGGKIRYPGDYVIEITPEHPQFPTRTTPGTASLGYRVGDMQIDASSPYVQVYKKGKLVPKKKYSILDQAVQETPEVLSAKEPFEMSDISNWREFFSNYNPNITKTVKSTTQSTEFNPSIFDFNKGNTDTRFEFFEPGKFINYDLSKMSTDEVVKTFGPKAKHLKALYDVAAANNFEGKYTAIAKDVESKLSKMFAINPEDADVAAGLAKAKGIYDIPEYTERFKKYGNLGETFIQDAKSRLDNIQLQGISRDSKITGQHGVEGSASTTPHPIQPTITLSNDNRSSIIREAVTHEANHAAHGTKYQPKWMEIHNEKIRPVPKKDRKDFTNFDKYLDEMDELVERSKTAVEYAHETRLEGETLDQALDRVFEVANKDVYNSEIPSDIRQMVKNYTKDSVLKFWKQFLGGLSIPIGVGIGASQSQLN